MWVWLSSPVELGVARTNQWHGCYEQHRPGGAGWHRRWQVWRELFAPTLIVVADALPPAISANDAKAAVVVYQPSTRIYKGVPDIDYPFHDKMIVVTNCGRICLDNKKINFSTAFAGHAVAIKEVHDDIWLVSFMDYDLGYFDLETRVLEPLEKSRLVQD